MLRGKTCQNCHQMVRTCGWRVQGLFLSFFKPSLFLFERKKTHNFWQTLTSMSVWHLLMPLILGGLSLWSQRNEHKINFWPLYVVQLLIVSGKRQHNSKNKTQVSLVTFALILADLIMVAGGAYLQGSEQTRKPDFQRWEFQLKLIGSFEKAKFQSCVLAFLFINTSILKAMFAHSHSVFLQKVE